MRTPIDKLMDLHYTQRWTLVGTNKESTVASHSFNVAMIAMEIRKRMRNNNDVSEQEICYYALIHDVKETYTGDLPTPTKTKLKEEGVDVDAIDFGFENELEPSIKIKSIIKAADLIENHLFIDEHGTGTRARVAAADVRGRLRRYLDGASEDLREAAVGTWGYIFGRVSDAPEEGKRVEKDREARTFFSRSLCASSVVGGES